MVVSKRANRIRASGNVRSDDDNDEDNKHHDSHVDDDDDDDDDGGAKPVGGLVKVSKEGSVQKKHFEAFKYEGFFFHLGDPVLVAPDEGRKKPSVEIIKDIFKTEDGELIITGRRLYRPEEVEKRGVGIWQTDDSRQLFYSHRIVEVCAESVMHTCVVHFLPPGREVPNRKLRPGFIVQKVYDFANQSLRDFTDRDLKDTLR